MTENTAAYRGFVQAGLTVMGWTFVILFCFWLYIWADVFQIPSLTQSPKPLAASNADIPNYKISKANSSISTG